jgi:hypothetical protein
MMMDEVTHFHDTECELPREIQNNITSILGKMSSLTLMMDFKTTEEFDAYREKMCGMSGTWREVSFEQLKAMRVKAFGSPIYVSKSPDEYRRLFIAGLKHCLSILEK